MIRTGALEPLLGARLWSQLISEESEDLGRCVMRRVLI